MNQPCEIRIFPTTGPCQHRWNLRHTGGRKRCGKPSFARLDNETARCMTHLEEQMDYVENVSRKEKGEE